MPVSGVITPSGCFYQKNGGVVTTTTGGFPPYSYRWSNGSTGADLVGVPAGAYWVKVWDSTIIPGDDEPMAVASFVIPASNLKLDFTIQQPTQSPTGTIKAVPVGGVAPFIFLWDTGETTDTIEAPLGTHTCTVTDSYGCQKTDSVVLIEQLQQDIDELVCCAGGLASKYVCQRKDGLFSEAKKTIAHLKILKGYIRDLCVYFDNRNVFGGCLSFNDAALILEKAKRFCECCKEKTDYIAE